MTQAEAAWQFLLVKASLHRAMPGMIGCYTLVFEDGSELFWNLAQERWDHSPATRKPFALSDASEPNQAIAEGRGR